jgi:hypothetical protein
MIMIKKTAYNMNCTKNKVFKLNFHIIILVHSSVFHTSINLLQKPCTEKYLSIVAYCD